MFSQMLTIICISGGYHDPPPVSIRFYYHLPWDVQVVHRTTDQKPITVGGKHVHNHITSDESLQIPATKTTAICLQSTVARKSSQFQASHMGQFAPRVAPKRANRKFPV